MSYLFKLYCFQHLITKLVSPSINGKNAHSKLKPDVAFFSRRQLDGLTTFLRLAKVTPTQKTHKQIRESVQDFLIAKYAKDSNVELISQEAPKLVEQRVLDPYTGEKIIETYELSASDTYAYPGLRNIQWSNRVSIAVLNELWVIQAQPMKLRCFGNDGKSQAQALASELLVEAKNAWDEQLL